jgi:asparagine synthase (glutamine-hydrolysing)
MCGIAGITHFDFKEDTEPLLRRMLSLMRHRGPDSLGMYKSNFASLGSARLSIIDLDTGDQPIHNEDKSVWVVLNGEIFNYPELRQDLVSRGHRFYTRTDTEVLVHLYEEHGTDLFQALNGQFALAIWDERRQRLLLGRDRVGIHPLHYSLGKNRLIFGSEVKTLFADPSTPRRIDLQTLSDIFTCWTPLGDSTAFEGIKQIPPGHYALFSREGFRVHPYWRLSFQESSPWDHSLGEWVEELKGLLLDAARIRLRADVPVGAYLSGGLDSTYISTLVKRHFDNHLCTFSVGFADKRFDEAPYQSRAVEALKTDHRSIRCTEEDIGEIFPRVIWHTETPILRTAPAPLFLLSRLVRESRFKVVLTGEGADEFFAGYNIFKEDRVRRFWARDPGSRLRPRLLERLYPYIFSPENGKAKVFLQNFFGKSLSGLDSPAYSHLLRWQNTAQLKALFARDLFPWEENLNGFLDRFISALPAEYMTWHPLSRAQYTEVTLFLSNYLLSSQGDRMAMGNSVEGRFPFLDHRVIEFAGRVPPRFRLRGLKEKYILKEAARGQVPSDLIDRPKQPYRAPISGCFFGARPPDYATDLLSEGSIRKTGLFDPGSVSRLFSKCRRQAENLLSERENMALVGILSTQLLDHLFLRDFPPYPVEEPEELKVSCQDAVPGRKP